MKKSDIKNIDATSDDLVKIITSVNLIETILEEDCDLVISGKDAKGNTWEAYEVYSNRSLGLLSIDKDGDLNTMSFGNLDGDLLSNDNRDLKNPYLLIFKNNNLKYSIDDDLIIQEFSEEGYNRAFNDDRYEVFEDLPNFILTAITKHIFEKSGAKYTKELHYDGHQIVMTPEDFKDLGEAFKDDKNMKQILGDNIYDFIRYDSSDFEWTEDFEHLNQENFNTLKKHFGVTSKEELIDAIDDVKIIKEIFKITSARCHSDKDANECYKEALKALTYALGATYDKGTFYVPLDQFAIYATNMSCYRESTLDDILSIGQIEFDLDREFYGDFDQHIAEYYNEQIAEELEENNIQ